MVASINNISTRAAAEKNFIRTKKPRYVVSLLIDNYDSYTYNIMQMVAQVNGFSSSVTVIKNDDYNGQFAAAWDDFVTQTNAIASALDVQVVRNVIISPGPGHPAVFKDFGMCAEAIRSATVPVLGVCLGHQGLAQVYSGKVMQATHVMHGRMSRVFVEDAKDQSLFAYIPSGFEVVRYHSLVIDPSKVPEGLEVIARTEDGVIMAVRHRTKQQFGVQFHPEAVCSEFGYQLFQNFRDLTLGHCTSKCELHHSNRSGQDDKVQSQDKQKRTPEVPIYRVFIQRVSSRLASLEFAEFVFRELFGKSKRSFWLDSSNYDTVVGTDAAAQSRCSIMGDNSGPMSYCVEYDAAKVELRVRHYQKNGDAEHVEVFPEKNILAYVRDVTNKFQCHDVTFEDCEHDQEANAKLPFAFRGGFVGYLGYEVLGSDQENKKQCNGNTKQVREERAPDASFLFADQALVFDHRDGNVYSLSLSKANAESEHVSQDWHKKIKNQVKRLYEMFCQKADACSPLSSKAITREEKVIFRPSRTRAQYVADIEEIQRLIRKGETYEVCLTNTLRADYALRDPLAFYRMLRHKNPAPFAGFYLSNPKNRFQIPVQSNGSEDVAAMEDTYAICCSSPERFLQLGADGWMESKPIKGTRRRGRDPTEDAAIAKELGNCEKDRAENMMIADLVRNDFGIVARVGSVHVPRLMGVETYASVHQLVTTVRAQRNTDTDAVDVLRATFPGGSMTGAPRKRTMHILRELERAPRGVYSGSLGFLSIDGSCDLNIIIRTAIVTPNHVTLGAGGAIVALSDSDDEYDEMLLKARALVATIGAYATGREDGSGARVVVTSSVENVDLPNANN